MLNRSILRQFRQQYPNPYYYDWQALGIALEWRRSLIERGATGPFEHIIQRQIEDELDDYQHTITELADALQAGDIEEDEFKRRLDNLTIAILLLAYLRGSDTKDDDQEAGALATLASGGRRDITVDYFDIPDSAAQALQDDIDYSRESDIGAAILSGSYEDSAGALASRLGLWVTTALGAYALGQLFKTSDPYLQWTYGPTDHCGDCLALNGQIHRASG